MSLEELEPEALPDDEASAGGAMMPAVCVPGWLRVEQTRCRTVCLDKSGGCVLQAGWRGRRGRWPDTGWRLVKAGRKRLRGLMGMEIRRSVPSVRDCRLICLCPAPTLRPA